MGGDATRDTVGRSKANGRTAYVDFYGPYTFGNLYRILRTYENVQMEELLPSVGSLPGEDGETHHSEIIYDVAQNI